MTIGLLRAQQPEPSDATAIAASLHAPTAFSTVFERHHAAVHGYLARRLGVDLADELAAEAFAVAFAKRGRYDGSFADARPWLFGRPTRSTWPRRPTRRRPAPHWRPLWRCSPATSATCCCIRMGRARLPGDRHGAVDLARHGQVTPSPRPRTRAPIPGGTQWMSST